MEQEIDFGYKEDIVATRKGGFGSSDAKIILKLSEGGELNATDRKRIAEMLGLKEHEDVTTWAMQRGNEYEQYAFKAMQLVYPQAVSNPFYKSEELSDTFGFNIFNHIDMEVETEEELIWYEMKTSVKETADLLHEYNPQLAWHWMLLSEKAASLGKKPKLILLHYPFPQENFDIEHLRSVEIPSIPNPFMKGFDRMRDILKDFTYQESNDPMDLIPSEMAEGLRILDEKLNQLKELEAYVDAERKALVANMEKYCVPQGITSLDTGTHKIVYVSQRIKAVTEFHLAKLKEDHPEIVEKYTKQVVQDVFDEDLMKAENPDLVAEYTEASQKITKSSIQIR